MAQNLNVIRINVIIIKSFSLMKTLEQVENLYGSILKREE